MWTHAWTYVYTYANKDTDVYTNKGVQEFGKHHVMSAEYIGKALCVQSCAYQ